MKCSTESTRIGELSKWNRKVVKFPSLKSVGRGVSFNPAPLNANGEPSEGKQRLNKPG